MGTVGTLGNVGGRLPLWMCVSVRAMTLRSFERGQPMHAPVSRAERHRGVWFTQARTTELDTTNHCLFCVGRPCVERLRVVRDLQQRETPGSLDFEAKDGDVMNALFFLRQIFLALSFIFWERTCVTCALTQGGLHTSCGIALTVPTGGWTVTGGWSCGRCTLASRVRRSPPDAVSVCWW